MRLRSWFRCPPSTARRACRLAFAPLAALPLFLAGCDDRALPIAPDADPALAASVAASTVRTGTGDLVTGDAQAFAQALKEIGPDGQVFVWLKETSTPRPSAEFLINLPGSAPETIALPAEAPNAKRRNTLGPASVRGASIDAVVRALQSSGVAEVERLQPLPVLIVRLSETKRLGALNALLRHPNVDYVSAVRARPVDLQGAPLGANPIDVKHTVHKVTQAWDLTRGSGAKIGVLDSGITRQYPGLYGLHTDAFGIVALGFVDDMCGSANSGGCDGFDDYGHGTAMVGLVGENDNGFGYVGIAPQATTYSMKIAWNTAREGHCGDNIFSSTRNCIEDDDFVRAVNYAAANRLHVLSMSFTEEGGSDVYRALSTAYYSYGVFLVAATGNSVGGSAKQPASYDVVMGVAGVDAGGNNAHSTAARDVSGYAGGMTLQASCPPADYCFAYNYAEWGGTSSATANVAGIVGLVRSYHPNETPAQIWERLVNTAVGPNRVVDAYAAIAYKRPLTVYISGNNQPQPYTYESWYASAANGTAPYTYAWYKDGVFVGSGASYADYVGDTGFQLQVTVTDALGATATNYFWVTPYFGSTCGGSGGLYSPYPEHETICVQ